MVSESFIEQSEQLEAKIAVWAKTWKHRKQCVAWKKHERAFGYGHCKHLAEAKYRKFKVEIDALFEPVVKFA